MNIYHIIDSYCELRDYIYLYNTDINITDKTKFGNSLFQNNTTALFVCLDDSSTLTISNLLLAHSFFRPINPKNGLKLSFLLSLCSYAVAFVVGEGDTGLFHVDHSSLPFIFRSKGQ